MMCPFFSEVSQLAICQEADCAIWDPERQACSVLVIAQKLPATPPSDQ